MSVHTRFVHTKGEISDGKRGGGGGGIGGTTVASARNIYREHSRDWGAVNWVRYGDGGRSSLSFNLLCRVYSLNLLFLFDT